jgi:hypothetical protein
LQGRCGKSKSAQPPVLGTDEVAQLPTDQRPRPLRMFLNHQFIPYPHLIGRIHQYQFQIFNTHSD